MGIIVDNRKTEVLELDQLTIPYVVFDKYYKKQGESISSVIMAIVGKVGNKLVEDWQANSERCFELTASTAKWDEMKIKMSDQFAHIINCNKSQTLPSKMYNNNNSEDSAEIDPEEYYLRPEKPPSRFRLSRTKVGGSSFYMTIPFNSASPNDHEIVNLLDLNLFKSIKGPLPNLLPGLEGISTPVVYFGLAGSATGCHVSQGLFSTVDLLIAGKSTWIFIDPIDNQKLEHLARENEKRLRDSQFKITCTFPLTHKKRYIPLWQLRLQNIKYEVVNQMPGNVIFVPSNVYHQSFNSTDCIKLTYGTTSQQWYDLSEAVDEFCNSSRICACGFGHVFQSQEIVSIRNLMQNPNHSLDTIRITKVESLRSQVNDECVLSNHHHNHRHSSATDDADSILPPKKRRKIASIDSDDNYIIISQCKNDPIRPGPLTRKDKADNVLRDDKDKEGNNYYCAGEQGSTNPLKVVLRRSKVKHLTSQGRKVEKQGSNQDNHTNTRKNTIQNRPEQYTSLNVQCEYCNYRYPRTYIEEHIDDKHSHKCDECHKVFKNRDLLTRHIRGTHSNTKFPCSHCKNEFCSVRARKEHIKRKHPETLIFNINN